MDDATDDQTCDVGPTPEAGLADNDLVVALNGFDGPIDLLLNMAKEQKVDLSSISILALAEQYLAYISEARRLRLELAADYLVMAAWLAYLKSRLLIPDPPADEPDPATLADALRFQLLRLEAMQKAAQTLLDLPQLESDIFLRGAPIVREVQEKPRYYLPLFDLLAALGGPLRRRKAEVYSLKPMRLFSLEESVSRMRRLLGIGPEWGVLQNFLPVFSTEEPLEAKSALASTFAATLELVKAGEFEVRQDGTFAPLYLRRRQAKPDAPLPDQETDAS
jgi:segregation and condensation protein A